MGAIYVGKKLGAGGFEKEVVLKQLLPEFTERPEFRDLFFREAKISASLDHVNIVRTFDSGRLRGLAVHRDGVRARGRPAHHQLAGPAEAQGRCPPGRCCTWRWRSWPAWPTPTAGAAQNGAPLGIIHRDVSPSNILCSGQGEVKLSDFGIAKATTFSSVFYRVRGKVGYMSPEQAQNETLDARSDLFSLAVCIFETLDRRAAVRRRPADARPR